MEPTGYKRSAEAARHEKIRGRIGRTPAGKQKKLSPGRRMGRIVFAHAIIIFSVLILTFFTVDRFNTAMGFMTSEISKWFIAFLAALGLINGLMTVTDLWQ